jgi:excisionase family DNA binding protein
MTTQRLTVSIYTAAEMLEVSSTTVERWIKNKKLRASKIARRVMVRVSDIEKMLDANPCVEIRPKSSSWAPACCCLEIESSSRRIREVQK